MANITKLYSDIDFTFIRKPGTNDVALSYDAQAVIRSIRNLLLTRHYERPFNSELGSNLDTILFENYSTISASVLEGEIRRIVENYEPRALLTDIIVNANPDKNAYDVTLTFFIEKGQFECRICIKIKPILDNKIRLSSTT